MGFAEHAVNKNVRVIAKMPATRTILVRLTDLEVFVMVKLTLCSKNCSVGVGVGCSLFYVSFQLYARKKGFGVSDSFVREVEDVRRHWPAEGTGGKNDVVYLAQSCVFRK